MKYQNFVEKVGFGSKGYSLLLKNKKTNAVFISGINANYSIIHHKIKKILGNNIPWLKIRNRNSVNEINKMSKVLINKKVSLVIVSGGGSIIDFSKNIVRSIRAQNEVSFYIIPSRVGSGAEASFASIVNLKNKKLIEVDESFLPNGIIYDLDFLLTLSKQDLIVGSVDAITHCLESLSSINKNDYLDFFSVSAINHFIQGINIDKFLKKKIVDKRMLKEYCILSFNGGISQNNAGSGLCHALAHSAEKFTGLPHTTCISFFLIPVINYSLKTDSKYLNKFNKKFKRDLFKMIKFLNSKLDFKKIKGLILNDDKLLELIETAKKDPCWKIHDKSVKVNILMKIIKKFKI